MSNKPQSKNVDELSVSAIRSLCIDMINKANSGHPGMALDAAPIAYALWRDHLVVDPAHPEWVNRDRLVFSCGHVSALLYSMLHLGGYGLSMDDIKSFRQLGSLTPGHPEFRHTKGIDATSGPLGQGIAQAVGMAIAEAHIRASYKDGKRLMSHYTYCLCGDGCLQEGVSQEAISLAGHYRLNKLILIYDENGATLDGPTSDSLTENVKLRFLASEWNVLEVNDGNDVEAVSKAIGKAKLSKTYPTLIIVKTRIGFGSKNEGSHKTHGEPLGVEDGNNAKKKFGYDYPEFTVPEEVYDRFKETFAARGAKAYADYQKEEEAYASENPEEAQRFRDAFADKADLSFFDSIPLPEKDEATRASSGKVLKAVHDNVPFTFGGSADVAGSTKTNISGEPMFTELTPQGRDAHWGIREFEMAAAINGIYLHGGLRAYGACFFVFADYMKPAVRMASLEKIPSLFIFTHDSIAVGEDGPTHQPIEQLAMLRAQPNLDVYRPADFRETIAAYKAWLQKKDGPVAFALTRQNIPLLEKSDVEGALRGGYLVREANKPAVELLATGSEVSLALQAADLLEKQGIKVAVASLPCLEAFERQDKAYQDSVLVLPREKRVSIEMLSTFGWAKYAALNLGIDDFGASGKANEVIASRGFTPDEVAKAVASFVKAK